MDFVMRSKTKQIFFIVITLWSVAVALQKGENDKSPKFDNPVNSVNFPPVPPEFWSADGECVDNPSHAEDCKVWAEKGYCNSDTVKHYPRWMKRNCKMSCNFCAIPQSRLVTFVKISCALFFSAWIFGLIPVLSPRFRWMSHRVRKMTRFAATAGITFLLYFV